MHNQTERAGVWAYQEFINYRPVNGEVKSRNILHGRVSPSKFVSGDVFQLAVTHVDPFGFTHRNVPNACVVP